jgi:hypothetical protein
MAAESPRVARAIAAVALVLALGLVVAARGSPEWSADHPAPLALQHYQEAEGTDARWYFESFASELPAALARDFERAPSGPLAFVRGRRTCFQRAAPRFDLEPAQLECATGIESGPAVVRLASRCGARMLILELPRGWKPVALVWSGGRVEFPGNPGRTLRLAGFGTGELAFDCEREDAQDRQGQIELFEIDGLRESAAHEWTDKRTSEFVPLSWGDVTIVHSTRKL